MTTHPTIRSPGGLDLHATFYPGTDPRGVLIVSHGLGEHSECYDAVAREVAALPQMLDVLTFDYRGHGRSPGKRGVIRSYADFLDDLDAALAWAEAARPGAPLYLLGHSNGGLVAIHAGLRDDGRIAGLVLSNPSLRIAAAVPRHKYVAAMFLRRFAPRVTLASTVLDEHLTSDPASLAARKSDTLRHGKISAPLYFGMVEGGASANARAEEVRLPVLMLISGLDSVVDPATTLAFFERIGSAEKSLKIFPEMLHEPLNEVGREAVVATIVDWLARQLSTASRTGSPAPA